MNLFRIILFSCISISLSSQEIRFEERIWQKSEYYNLLGDRKSSINIMLRCIDSLDEEKDKNIFYLAALYNQLGARYQTYGEWDESAYSYVKSINYIDEISKDDIFRDKNNLNILKSKVYLNLGLLYVKMGSSSSKFYLDIAEEIALKEYVTPVLFVLYKVTNRLDEGVKFANKIQNNQYLSNYYYLIARSNDSMSHYFDSARIVLPEIQDAKLQNFQYHAFIVDHFLKNNQLDSALFHCERAKEIAPMLNDDEVKHHYLSCFSSVYLALGDTMKYLQFRNLSEELLSKYRSSDTYDQLFTLDNFLQNQNIHNKLIVLEKRELVGIVILVSFLLIFLIIYFSIKKLNKININLNESKKNMDRLFSIISHDLRGAIASIKLLSADEDNIKEIEKGSDALLLEFDSLLYWSVNQMDKIDVKKSLLDVNEVLDEIIELSRVQSEIKKIRINNCLDGDFVAYLDRNMFKIIIRNILNNAIRYSRYNSDIKIRVIEKDDYVFLSIIDSGTGFGSKYSKKGFGLGLELCNDFIELNNGELIINSSLTGSTVTVKVPLSE